MAHVYSVPISVAAHTAQVDILEVLTATDKPVVLIGWSLSYTSEVGDAQEEILTWALKRVTGAPTSGSGGTTPTAVPLAPNESATSMTVEAGNTTKLSGGTSALVKNFAVNVRMESLYVPVPEGRLYIAGGTRLVLEETTTPADSVTGPVGYVLLEEIL
jgi:hypothetical protein